MSEPTTQAAPLTPEEEAEVRAFYDRDGIPIESPFRRLLATLDRDREAARALPGVEQLAEAIYQASELPEWEVRPNDAIRPGQPSEVTVRRARLILAALPPDSRAERLTQALRAIVDGAEHIDGDPLSYENIERARAALASTEEPPDA